MKGLPRELQLDADIRAWVSEALATKGEEFVESNIEATIVQSKTNPKAFLKKALFEDFGESYRSKRKAADEKARQVAQILEQERERELAEAMRLQEARKFFDSLPEKDREEIMAEARKTSPFKLPELVESVALNIAIKNYMPAGQATCNR